MGNVSTLKTDAKLLDQIEAAAHHRLSASDIMEQRVSFVYGSLKEDSGVTREQVRKVLLGQQGIATEGR